jgi:hypothetical protein
MKKILLVLIIILTGYATWLFVTQGFEFDLGFVMIDVPSYQEVTNNKKELDSKLTSLKTKNDNELVMEENKVETSMKTYEARKQEYDMLAMTASEKEIAEANKIERYLLDYLWIKVGNYASDNDVKFKMTPNTNEQTLTFDITGKYISVINFIYDLENDLDLNFEIDGIVIQGGSTSEIVKANFNVEGIRVVTSPDAPEV